MDCDDINTYHSSSDPQSSLVLEFSNHASLKTNTHCSFSNNKLSYPQEKVQVIGIENKWSDDGSSGDGFSLCQVDSPIPLPPPLPPPAATTNDMDTVCEGDLEALFAFPEEKDSQRNVEAGVCGLRNLGNTCFMSTGIQCLVATPALVQCLLHKEVSQADSLISHLSELTRKMWSGHFSALKPLDFKQTLGLHYPQFKDFRQHDCQEFLALLLDGLHEQMNTVSRGQPKMQCLIDGMANNLKPEPCFSSSSCFDNACHKKAEAHSELKKIESKTERFLSRTEEGSCCSSSSIIEESMDSCDTVCNGALAMNGNSCCYDSIANNVSHVKTVEDKADVVCIEYPCPLNNMVGTHLSGLEDIIKDAKTSNVNVLVAEQEVNNGIKFDSDKFPRKEKVWRRDTVNFKAFHIYENNMANVKRGKSSTVMHYCCPADFRDGLDMKRFKMQAHDKNHRMQTERMMHAPLEKNFRMECERKQRDEEGAKGTSGGAETGQSLGPQHQLEADKHWQQHLALNQSAIVDTFQGQFRSTVVCSVCCFVSVTYEPFMYLSVPLPHAMERQLRTTFVSAKSSAPVQYLLTLNKQDRVVQLKEELLKLVQLDSSAPIILAEVLDNHIAKFLDENLPVRFVDDVCRSVYAFELETKCQKSPATEVSVGNEEASPAALSAMEACTHCLEEKESHIRRHRNCACLLCDSCVQIYCERYGGQVRCPVCRTYFSPLTDLVPIVPSLATETTIRMLNIPIVFRLDSVGNENNNMRAVLLFGHPRLVRLPSRLLSEYLHVELAALVPYEQPYNIVLVDGQGYRCSRCMFNEHCRGCVLPSKGALTLRSGDTLGITFTAQPTEVTALQHVSMLSLHLPQKLSLYDCVRAFSQSEVLDEHNPWYCPQCQKNQCATKTLSIWRYPNCLIVYLKRFVFRDCVSTKVEDKVTFPLCGLQLSQRSSLYDLYACVCHVGGVSAGHYTAYTQHVHTGEWHYFNDDCVTKQRPQEEDFSNAYILFYISRGTDGRLGATEPSCSNNILYN